MIFDCLRLPTRGSNYKGEAAKSRANLKRGKKKNLKGGRTKNLCFQLTPNPAYHPSGRAAISMTAAMFWELEMKEEGGT